MCIRKVHPDARYSLSAILVAQSWPKLKTTTQGLKIASFLLSTIPACWLNYSISFCNLGCMAWLKVTSQYTFQFSRFGLGNKILGYFRKMDTVLAILSIS